MRDASRHEATPYSIMRDSAGRRPETLCGPMLGSLFTLQSSLCHGRMQPTRHEDGTRRRKQRCSELAVEAERQIWEARMHTAKAGCH